MKNRSTDILLSETLTFSNEEAYELILNNLEGFYLLVSKDLKIIAPSNASKQRVKDYFEIEIESGTSALDLNLAENKIKLTKIYQEVFSGEEKLTETIIKQKGVCSYLEIHFKPLKNSKREIVTVLVILKDITKNKKAESSLKEIEERWRFALEGANQGVWDWNVQTGEVFYSDSYKRLYGFELNELKGRIEEWQEMIHPDDCKKMEDAVEEHVSSQDPYYESTYRIKTKGGQYKWILARGMLIERDTKGKPLRMVGIHTDITRQINTEKTYRVLFYSNPLPMWTYDLETLRFLTVNNAAVNHYGYSKEEFLSMTIKDIRLEEDLQDLQRLVEKRKNLSYLKTATRHVKKNGDIIYVEVSTHKLDTPDSNSVLVVSHDITSKIIAEKELKKSNERFLIAGRATSDAIYDWNIDTNEVYWGEGLQTLFGFDPKEVPVSLWENMIHPQDRKRIHDSVDSALADGNQELWKEEYRFAKADGSFRHVLDRGFIIRDSDGKPVRMIGSMQDITERKYAEQILSLERTVFELSNRPDVEFRFIIESLLRGIEEIHGNAYTSLLLLRDDQTIEPFVAPRIPDEFSEKINGVKIGPDVGSCGTAMWRKETVIVEDIDTHPLWEKYKSLAQQFGLKSCWSLPIVHSSGMVIGSFAIYYKEKKKPSTAELNTLERIRNILRILMEHHWSLDEIKKANERFDIIMNATHDLIWDWNLETNIIYRDEPGLKKVYGIDDNKPIENIQQWLTHIHPQDMEKVQKIISDILQAKQEDTFDIEYRFRRSDGTYSHVYDRGMIIRNEEGKPVRMIGAAQDISERKLLEEELLQNELEKQKAINQATIDSQEQERTEIGKELHDNVNQILTTTKLYLDLALSNNELKDELIAKSGKNIMSVINEIRQLSRSLMDPTIGDLGLIDSLNDLIENINLTGKLHVSLKAERKMESFLGKGHKLTIFRIIQEALNNTIKYAQATTVVISCKLCGTRAEVIIQDNGIGFEPSQVKMGAGLKNIQNRVYLINGTYSIQSAPEKGCTIIINFPIINLT
jgi:PAS domain S-box-containing protein